ncbi:hypothetical protein SAMN05444161_0139 [Rhizobiales bacterium GAS191]|jgi:hypothetical protein|nr:hypothetical protein SAMN05444161_0139 [Rhizobiales bacterium GAS191]SED26271.1 hypothetical protein SAMN05519104_3169 [Rhizobiales bacterium GAS188]
MKMHIIIAAIASLALIAANPASARPSRGNVPQSAQIEKSTGSIALASPALASPAKVDHTCRRFSNYHAKQRCKAINGIPDNN